VSPNCSLCDRKSLLIYPVRYAVACPRGAAKAPALSGNFKIDGRAPQSVANAKYTLRALRAGYLYTYDEKRRRLRGYMVLPDGLMWSFVPGTLPPPESSVRRLAAGCATTGDLAFVSLGRCVDVEHTPGVDEATKVWFGWSNVAWTKALVEKALSMQDGPKWRAQHMQCIDIAAMIGGSAPHTGEFQASRAHIAPFAMDSQALKDAFEFSNTPTRDERRLRDLADRIGQAMTQSPNKKGFVIAVNDPVGVTNDLAELTILSADAGFDEKMQEGKLIYDLLKRTETNVRNSASDGVVSDDEEETLSQNDMVDGGDPVLAAKKLWQIFKAGGPTAYGQQQAADAKKYGTSQSGRQSAAADRAWFQATHDSDGKPTLNMDRINQFPDQYASAVKAYQPTLEKLIAAHAAWLSSELLADWMAGVHDATDLASGFAYSESVAQCVSKAAGTPDCTKQLNAWLDKGDATDLKAIYVRALLFNQDDIANAAGRQIKPSDTQLEQFLNLYKNALKRLDKKAAGTLLDRLSVTTANILVNALTSTGRETARFLAAVRLTLHSGHAVKAGTVSANELRKWVMDQAKQAGVDFNTSMKTAKSDAYAASKTATNAASKDSTIYAYELDIAKLEQEGVIDAGTIKTVRIPLVDSTSKWLGSSAPQEFHLGVATAIVQLAACKFTFNDWHNSDQFSQVEAGTKFIAAAMSLAGTVIEAMSETVHKSKTHPLSAFILKQWPQAEEASESFARFGRIFGAAGGAVAALYDLAFNAPEQFKGGNYYLTGLYVASGGLGIYIAIAGAFFPAAVLFWPAVIASFVVAILIAIANSNALQNWISKCYFGIGEHYENFDAELSAYNKAVGA
jgi:hypothetical protein